MTKAKENGGSGLRGLLPIRKISLLGLIGATFCIVSGGPYGLEDVIQEAGYFWAALFLLIVPFIWSLPTTLMVSELSSTLPEEGGYYVWVRRGLGPFWGFQEGWLSLAASAFDMAIYPLLFVTYLGYVGPLLAPSWTGWEALKEPQKGLEGLILGSAMIAFCVLMNLRPPRSLGRYSFSITVVLLIPFVVLSALALSRNPADPADADHTSTKIDYVGALFFALWNYMGWDNASTFAGEVERPQRTYPLAMAATVWLVALTYVLPLMAVSRLGINPDKWEAGAWVMVAREVGGPGLAIAIGLGGMISALGIFNSLVLSYSRLPVVLAQEGFLPGVFTRRLSSGAPWVSVIVCAFVWGLAMQLGLERVLALDVMLYGLSLLLEFAALVALRLREPNLPRPFRVPGGTLGAVLLGLFPALLIGLGIYDQAGRWKLEEGDTIAPGPALLLGLGLVGLGFFLYYASRWFRKGERPQGEKAR